MSEDLHILLQKSGIPGPLVPVGHSLGGLYIRYFAARYAGDVSGMILVESSHEDQSTLPRWLPFAANAAGHSGITRLFVRFEDPAAQAVYHSSRSVSAAVNEFAAVAESHVDARTSRWGTNP